VGEEVAMRKKPQWNGWRKWGGLLALAGLAVGCECQETTWLEPVRSCSVSYAECSPERTSWWVKFEVGCPGSEQDLAIRLKPGTPHRCWLQAAKRWGCFVEYARGQRNGVKGCQRFPLYGCGDYVQ
jgi:hypothetical protein